MTMRHFCKTKSKWNIVYKIIFYWFLILGFLLPVPFYASVSTLFCTSDLALTLPLTRISCIPMFFFIEFCTPWVQGFAFPLFLCPENSHTAGTHQIPFLESCPCTLVLTILFNLVPKWSWSCKNHTFLNWLIHSSLSFHSTTHFGKR